MPNVTRVETPFGNTPVLNITPTTALVTANPVDGTSRATPFGVPQVAVDPTLAPGVTTPTDAYAVYSQASKKLWIWDTSISSWHFVILT